MNMLYLQFVLALCSLLHLLSSIEYITDDFSDYMFDDIIDEIINSLWQRPKGSVDLKLINTATPVPNFLSSIKW